MLKEISPSRRSTSIVAQHNTLLASTNAMVVVILLLLLLCLPQLALAQNDCNICGDGNFIGYPQGVVTITYKGENQTNNCQTWQNIVANPVAISDYFCRNEMIYYAAGVSSREWQLACEIFMVLSCFNSCSLPKGMLAWLTPLLILLSKKAMQVLHS